jgi:hypothetical protein
MMGQSLANPQNPLVWPLSAALFLPSDMSAVERAQTLEIRGVPVARGTSMQHGMQHGCSMKELADGSDPRP